MTDQTLGEKRVRVSFNPGNGSIVEHIKGRTAELIDIVENAKSLDPRLASLAQTEFEIAAMWAVKLVTTPAPPLSDPDQGDSTDGPS